MDIKQYKKELRKEKIKAREDLPEEIRAAYSREICRRLSGSPEYARAKTIFVYKWVKGEVRLDEFEKKAASDGKRLVYPLCVSKTEMIAIEPGEGEAAWKESGFMGIREPVPEHGTVIDPADIDLIIAPCSSFDDQCRRLGMGGGFYDRYLPECVNASIIAVGFEVQRAGEIPADEYDFAVNAVATEDRIIRKNVGLSYQETLDYINSVRLNQWKLGLSRTRELLDKLGNPQKDLRFVHVGGTNGKGSTCAMLESVLRAAGYRTAIFPSPFIEDFRERMQVSGEMISREALCRLTGIVKAAADTMEDEPSHFEIVTAIGMMYFREMKCDIVVLEVGLGGEFDATNIIDPPELAVLTNIGFDHTDYLGNTLAEIAATKAGIIKTGTSVVVYPNVPEVTDVLTQVCKERGCPMEIVDFGRISIKSADLTGQILEWKKSAGPFAETVELKIPLLGDYQSRNAAVALTVVEKLREKGWAISEEAVSEGLAHVSWPARFELLGSDPVFILDGGHNIQCAEAVAESVRDYLPGRKVTLIIGMLRDKDYQAVLDVILPAAERCICLAPLSERALNAEELAEIINSKGVPAHSCESAAEAVRECLAGPDPVLAFGSFYMAGEIRKAYREAR